MKYLFRERMISVRDVFDIKNEAGDVIYTITSRILSLRQKFVLENPDGSNVAVVTKRLISPWPQYKIKLSDGTKAKVRRAFFRVGFGPKFIIKTPRGRMTAEGNFLAREYDFELGGKKVAEASRHWVTMTDTYGVDIFDDQDAPLILCCVVVIDAFAASEEEQENQPEQNE